MFIEKLEVENWKCFLKKKCFEFQKHELISQKNGTGKSSIMEAIQYAIYGKPPVGFNLNTVRQDENLPCRVFIQFSLLIEGEYKTATIERIFGTNKPICELKINDILIAESVRTIEAYMNNIINADIVARLWTTSLTDSDITSNSFFTNSVLEDILKDPKSLSLKYSSMIRSNNKIINGFDEKIINVDEIKSQMDEIQSKLKDKTNGNINSAKTAEKADIQINLINEKLGKYSKDNIPSYDEAKKFNSMFKMKEKYQSQLEEEIKKKENIFSNFTKSEIEKIDRFCTQNGKCIICNSPYTKEHHDNLLNELSLTGRSEQKIKDLKDNLAFIEKYNKEICDLIIDLENQKVILNRCKNYKEIIEVYDSENEKLWDEYNKLQKEYALGLKQKEKLNEINKLKKKVEEDNIKLEIIDNYIKKAKKYYTAELMDKASQYLSNINQRYQGICLLDDSFYVIVENADTFACTALPVARLSKGEKTMCALSILFAIHNQIVPELPLIFDETFSALDVENLSQVQRFLRTQNDTQIFVITHDTTWIEF